MPVHCSKCGEELLGAVNRCWKCGQTFALPPEMDGRPPVRAAVAANSQAPLEAIVVEQVEQAAGSPFRASETPAPLPMASARMISSRSASTGDLIEARRAGQMAMGGTVASLVLGVFAAAFAAFWPPAAIIAVLGLMMGIWGLSSPRRNWALLGMLLCCLAIGFGTFGMARRIYIGILQNKAISIDDSPATDEP